MIAAVHLLRTPSSTNFEIYLFTDYDCCCPPTTNSYTDYDCCRPPTTNPFVHQLRNLSVHRLRLLPSTYHKSRRPTTTNTPVHPLRIHPYTDYDCCRPPTNPSVDQLRNLSVHRLRLLLSTYRKSRRPPNTNTSFHLIRIPPSTDYDCDRINASFLRCQSFLITSQGWVHSCNR
jgi:hypothetical protein